MKKSFTLIELLIVIAIIAILAVGIIVLTIPGERLAQARDATRASHLKSLETALYLYDLDYGLTTLGITENLTEICNTKLGSDCAGLIDLSSLNITIPVDPQGGNLTNGTGYYVALINNKAVLYATKAETKETKIGIAEGVTFIYTWEDLHNIRDDLTGQYILMNNLNLSTEGYSIYNTGDGWLPIGTLGSPFGGIFDGNGRTISDLYINRPLTNYIGLFGAIGATGEIKNIGLINGDIIGEDYVGGIAGDNNGLIIKSYNVNNIEGEWTIGGIAGRNQALISEAYNFGSVLGITEVGGITGQSWDTVFNSYNIGSIVGNNDVGGLVGFNSGASIINSYNSGNILGGNYVGGATGYSTGPIINSYNAGNVSGNNYIGGLIGDNYSSITNSYFSNGPNNGHGTEEIDETNFYSQLHNVYDQGGFNPWISPPWSWLVNDFPKLNM